MAVLILGIPFLIAAIASVFIDYWKWNVEMADKRAEAKKTV